MGTKRYEYWLLVILLAGLAVPAATGQQQTRPAEPPPAISPLSGGVDSRLDQLRDLANDERAQPVNTQAARIVQYNFENSKKDAEQLATLASELHEVLDQQTGKSLSLEAVSRLERIEKLARKIHDETKGY